MKYKIKKITNVIITTIAVTAVTLLSVNSCKDGITDPNDSLKPGRRDYTWTVDTVSSPYSLFYLFSLWGSSPTNLWAVGTADESVNSLWHYDGTKWEKSQLRLSSNLHSIFGFDPTDIWMCDSPGGNIYHFDGIKWITVGHFPYLDYSHIYFNNIWGTKSDEIYIAGSAYDHEKGSVAILLRYNGVKWEYVRKHTRKENVFCVGQKRCRKR